MARSAVYRVSARAVPSPEVRRRAAAVANRVECFGTASARREDELRESRESRPQVRAPKKGTLSPEKFYFDCVETLWQGEVESGAGGLASA